MRPGIGRRGLLKFFGAAAIVAPAAAVAAKAEAKAPIPGMALGGRGGSLLTGPIDGENARYYGCCTMMVGSGEDARFDWDAHWATSDEPDDDY